MAQYTLADGDYPTAAILNTYAMGEGGAWTSWTPTVTQSVSVTVTNTRSRYARYGRTIHFSLELTVTGSGTAANAVVFSLPATAASSSGVIGIGYIDDDSATARFAGRVALASTTTFVLQPTSTDVRGSLGSATFTAGLASGDTIKISGTYEAAS